MYSKHMIVTILKKIRAYIALLCNFKLLCHSKQSVFKAYDLDCDGLISEEEFSSFTNNFQELDDFQTVDTDRLVTSS